MLMKQSIINTEKISTDESPKKSYGKRFSVIMKSLPTLQEIFSLDWYFKWTWNRGTNRGLIKKKN